MKCSRWWPTLPDVIHRFTFCALAFGLLAGCAEATAPQYTPPPAVEEPAVDVLGRWQLLSGELDGAPVEEHPAYPIDLEFTDSTVGGSAGCNGYTASSTLAGNGVRLTNFVITEIECEEPNAAIAEDRFLSSLRRINQVGHDGRILTLRGNGTELRFTPAS